MSDKKPLNEASNIFHIIIKASVIPNKVKCPVCGAEAKQIKGKEYECSNGYEFAK